MSTRLSCEAILDRRRHQPDRLANGCTMVDLKDALWFIRQHRGTDLAVLASGVRVKISKKEAKRIIKERIDSLAAAVEAIPEQEASGFGLPFLTVSYLAYHGGSFATIIIGKENYDRFNS